jgi:hypothetical protein
LDCRAECGSCRIGALVQLAPAYSKRYRIAEPRRTSTDVDRFNPRRLRARIRQIHGTILQWQSVDCLRNTVDNILLFDEPGRGPEQRIGQNAPFPLLVKSRMFRARGREHNDQHFYRAANLRPNPKRLPANPATDLCGGGSSAAPDNYFTAALIFSAASGETHLVQVASLFLR